VFRRDNKGESFEQQMGALRDQLGDTDELDELDDDAPSYQERGSTHGYVDANNLAPSAAGSAPVTQDPAAPTIPSVDATTTVVAKETSWKGEMASKGSVHIHGRLDGAIKADDSIFVAEGAEVDATLNAETVIVAGVSRGTVRASGKFEVLPTGRVAGDIQAPKLVVHEGAVMSGQLKMTADAATTAKPTSVIQRRANRGA